MASQPALWCVLLVVLGGNNGNNGSGGLRANSNSFRQQRPYSFVPLASAFVPRASTQEERLIGWKGETYDSSAGREIRPDEADARAMAQRGAYAELLSWYPRSYHYHKFMTPEECDHLIKIAEPSMQRSSVIDSVTGKVKLDPIRTSYQTFLRRGSDETVTLIEERLARFAMIPAYHGEDMQILRYQNGQKYDAHHDVAELNTNSGKELAAEGGMRAATALLYLSDVEEGGETVFPLTEWPKGDPRKHAEKWSKCGAQGVAVKPRKGDMLLFWSLDFEAKIDTYSMHAGCPVLKGTKWTATKWIHQKPFHWTPPKMYADAPKGCEDKTIECKMWAVSGECEKNPTFMVGDKERPGSCLWSCKRCDIAGVEVVEEDRR
ncbi:prolyl 4-hydroxylase [Pseudoscourfieldia marina]